MKRFIVVGALALVPSQVFAQSSGAAARPGAPSSDAALGTPVGHDINVSLGHYRYVEPGDLSIAIHGAKFSAEYTGTMSIDASGHWFAQANVRGAGGSTGYDGWCSPWLITPNSTSPNGYELDTGDPSPCSETGDKDWYLESRGLFGKDLIGARWGWSPAAGLGLRHLSNGTSGIPGYRTDNYLYVPMALTARTLMAGRNTLSFSVEYDRLLHGWQKTRDSRFGSGDVPATTDAPEFTIDGFSDVSFSQHAGWAVRASAKYQLARGWSVEPYFIHWGISPSPVNFETITYTVNGIAAQEQLGFYEPLNATNEFGVKLGFRFR